MSSITRRTDAFHGLVAWFPNPRQADAARDWSVPSFHADTTNSDLQAVESGNEIVDIIFVDRSESRVERLLHLPIELLDIAWMYESLRSSFLLELEPFRIGGARVTQQSRSSASTSTRTNQDSPVTSVSSATEHKDSSSLHISGLRSPSDLAQAFTKELNTPSAEPATYQPSASPPLSPQTDAAMLEIIESETGMTPIPDQLSASVSSNEEDENVGSQPFHKPPMIVPTLKIEDVDELFRQPSENHSDRWQHHDKPNVDDSGFAIKSEDSDSGYQEAVNRLSSVQQRVRDMKAGQAYTTSISSSISQHSRTGTSKTAPLPFSTNPRLGSGLLSSELSHDRAPGWQRRMAGPKIHNLEGVAESLNIAGKPTPRRQSAPFIPGSPMPTLNKQTFASRAYGKAVSPKKESEEDDLPDGSQTPSGHRHLSARKRSLPASYRSLASPYPRRF